MKSFEKIIILFFVALLSCNINEEKQSIIQQSFAEKIYEKNTSFFDELTALKRKKKVTEKLTTILDNYSEQKRESSKRLGKSLKKISEKQKTILKQYFLSLRKEKNKNAFTKTFLIYVENLDIDVNDKKFLLRSIDFYNKLMVYTDTYIKNYKRQINTASRFNPCGHRDCLDCCMYRKAQSLANSNWIDKAYFLSSAAYNVVAWVLSCSWDCRSGGGGDEVFPTL